MLWAVSLEMAEAQLAPCNMPKFHFPICDQLSNQLRVYSDRQFSVEPMSTNREQWYW